MVHEQSHFTSGQSARLTLVWNSAPGPGKFGEDVTRFTLLGAGDPNDEMFVAEEAIIPIEEARGFAIGFFAALSLARFHPDILLETHMLSAQARVDEFNLDHKVGARMRHTDFPGDGNVELVTTTSAAYVSRRGGAVVDLAENETPIPIRSLRAVK